MRPGPPSTLLLVLALLLALAGPPGIAADAPAAAPAGAPPEHPALQSATVDPTVTVLRLEVEADGDARWTVVHSFDLEDANETRAFERLAGEFERGEVGGAYLETMRRASEGISERTDREMRIRDVNRSATVENGTGRLVLTLTWTSFGRVTGDTVRVDDAFLLGTGTWLPGLAADERLVVSPPSGYRIDDAPSADSFRNGSLVWEGPADFERGYLSLLLALYLFRRRERPTAPAAEANGGVDADDAGTGTGTAGTDGTAEPGGGAGAEPTDDAEGDDGEDADEPAIDPELLSDEERVERLLRRNGGRMKQANIVKETNWSNAKVSQLLSAMDEDGRIDKLRIGRENLITLPDEEPGEIGE
ncbi:hypothetical protein BRC93_12790 [Halobacteriales archaeon QS_5_70_15]|nr:MAG: hypothetical protein BRC93_12790 [Halobacteriales archaeon QS_5_70_15]